MAEISPSILSLEFFKQLAVYKIKERFYGHMEIESVDRIGFCSIEFKEAVSGIEKEIIEFCKKI